MRVPVLHVCPKLEPMTKSLVGSMTIALPVSSRLYKKAGFIWVSNAGMTVIICKELRLSCSRVGLRSFCSGGSKPLYWFRSVLLFDAALAKEENGKENGSKKGGRYDQVAKKLSFGAERWHRFFSFNDRRYGSGLCC